MSILMKIFYHGSVQPHNNETKLYTKIQFPNQKISAFFWRKTSVPFGLRNPPSSGQLPGWCMNRIFLIRNTPPSCFRRDFCLKMSLRVYLADSFFSLCSQFLKLGVSRKIISIQMHHLPSGRAILTGTLRVWCILR